MTDKSSASPATSHEDGMISELRGAADTNRSIGRDNTANLLCRAADSLEEAMRIIAEGIRQGIIPSAESREIEVIDPYVMDLVRKHGHEMTNSEIVQKFLPKEKLSVPSEIAERPSAVYTSNESRLAHALREFIEASKRTEPKYGDCLALAEWTLNETSVSATRQFYCAGSNGRCAEQCGLCAAQPGAPTNAELVRLWMDVRLRAEGSDWKRGGETLSEWAYRKLK